MKILNKLVSIKEVAKIRDKLIKTFEKSKTNLTEKDVDCYENVYDFNESIMDWVIEEIQTAFDFDGEEE